MRKNTHDPYRTSGLPVPQLPASWADDAMPAWRPLSVLAYVDRYPPHVNAGAEWYLHHVLRDVAARGHTVRVATGQGGGPVVTFEGVEVWPHTMVDTLADDVDVLIGHLMWTREVVHLANARGIPLVYVLHNDMQVQHWSLTAENLTLMVANSQWVADTLRLRMPCVVVRPVVLLDDYALAGDAFDREFVTLVNPNPEKGAATLYGLAHVQRARQFLAVAGGYGQQIRPKPGDRNVTWQHSTPAMRDVVYARTRVLLVPSRYESWGRVAVEAMAAGCVVIAHPTPGLREALGDAAIFVDRDDLKGWQHALDQLDDRPTFAEWSLLSRWRAAVLDAQARDDLDTWENALRVAATAQRVRSGA